MKTGRKWKAGKALQVSESHLRKKQLVAVMERLQEEVRGPRSET